MHSKLFQSKSTILISKFAKYLNLKKFESKIFIFKVKIGLSPELMNDILEFIEKRPSLRLNSELRPDNPDDKI